MSKYKIFAENEKNSVNNYASVKTLFPKASLGLQVFSNFVQMRIKN